MACAAGHKRQITENDCLFVIPYTSARDRFDSMIRTFARKSVVHNYLKYLAPFG